MKIKNVLNIFCLTMFLCACASSRKADFEASLGGQKCEVALQQIPENDPSLKFIGQSQAAAGTVFSYAATGIGYTTDVVIMLTAGVAFFAVACAPLIAAAYAGGHVNGSIGNATCLPLPLGDVSPPTFGRDIYRSTDEMRCPDLTSLSRSLRRVAGCYETRGTRADLVMGKNALDTVTANRSFYGCISKDEREAVRSQYHRLESSLEKLGENP